MQEHGSHLPHPTSGPHRPPSSSRALIVYPVPLLAEALAALLHAAGIEVIAIASRGGAIAALVQEFKPNVIVCDPQMPDINRQLVNDIIQRFPDVHVWVLANPSASKELDWIASSERVAVWNTQAPARTFLPQLTRSGATANKDTSGQLDALREADLTTRLDQLTRRERQILPLVASGLTVRQVAEQLNLSPSTVDNHKARIMKKLGLHKVAELTRVAIRARLIES